MADALFPYPPVFELPLSKGRDLYCDFIYEPLVVDIDGIPILDGNGEFQYEPADYPDDCIVKLEIDVPDASPVVATAVVTDEHAIVQKDFLIVDALSGGLYWRLKITYASGVDDVLCNGQTKRRDGSEK